jgi:DNA-binding NarL/FixJ family response regulator
MVRVLIIDDHPIIREGITKVLNATADFEVTGEASNAQEALQLLSQKSFDVVILDVVMPGRSGLEFLEQIKKSKPELRVLMISAHSEKRYALRAIKSGASGYITKDSAGKELVKALSKILSGGVYVSAGIADQLLFELAEDPGKPAHELLSTREFQVMQMIAAGNRLKEIASELSLSISTVSTHRLRILQKMGMKNNAELIQYVIQNNLLDN